MRNTCLTCLLLSSLAAPAVATPVTFGSSWDGTPPGTFADITGSSAELGLPDFRAGTWIITVDGGYSAWYGRDVVGFEGDTFCATAANGCQLQKPDGGAHPTVLQVYQDRPWHLWATTPSYTHLTSTGSQFAFVQTSATSWRWGLEDITLGSSDNDYQDVFGTLRFVSGPPEPPVIETHLVQPVPEPVTLVTLGAALLISGLRKRAV